MKERGLRSSCPFRARMLGVLTLSTTKEAAHAVWGPCAARAPAHASLNLTSFNQCSLIGGGLRRGESRWAGCFLRELHPGAEAEFGVDVGEVGLHGAR